MIRGIGKLSFLVGVVFFLALTSSAVRADSLHAERFIEQLGDFTVSTGFETRFVEQLSHGWDSPLVEIGPEVISQPSETGSSRRFTGFSIAAFHRGPQIGLVGRNRPDVSQNPEPAAMVLLGTGLTALAAFARKKTRRRNKD